MPSCIRPSSTRATSGEAYRARLRQDPQGLANFEWAQRQRFIVREERRFTATVPGTFNLAAWTPEETA